jgi:DNA polymerase-1
MDRFKQYNVKSKMINQVHDEIVVDTHPDELDLIPKILHKEMKAVVSEIYNRYGYVIKVPLDVEVSQGKNWLETKLVNIGE